VVALNLCDVPIERNYRHKRIKFVTKSIDEYFEPEEEEIDLVVESTELSDFPVIDPWLHSEGRDSETELTTELANSRIPQEVLHSTTSQVRRPSINFKKKVNVLFSHIEYAEDLGKWDHLEYLESLFSPVSTVLERVRADERRITLPTTYGDCDSSLRYWRD
jgi:hypothetical protein